MSKLMSIDELAQLHGSFVETTKTEEPVAIQTPTTNVVNGNTALMGTNEPKDYRLVLYLPLEGKAPEGVEVVMHGTAYKQEITAKQKFISARIARKVRNYASTIAIAMTEFKDNGESDIYTAEDMLKIYTLMDDSVIDACENLVKVVLGVPDHLAQYITDVSLMENCSKILENNPSFFQND